MNYDVVWKILETLMIELRRKGETIPTEVLEDLKAAKTLMSLSKVDPSHRDTTNIEYYLGKVESNLLYLAEANFGEKYAENCLEKIQRARMESVEKEEPPSSLRFIPGIPRGEHWVRLKIGDLMNRKKVEAIADHLGLSHRSQRDDFLLIHGDKEKIKLLIKQISKEIKKSKRV